MVGGAHGLVGRHVLQHVVVVDRPDNVCVTTPHPQAVEVIALAMVLNSKSVVLQSVQVRPDMTFHGCFQKFILCPYCHEFIMYVPIVYIMNSCYH